MRMLLPLLLALLSTATARDPEPKGITTGTGHTVGFGELKVGIRAIHDQRSSNSTGFRSMRTELT